MGQHQLNSGLRMKCNKQPLSPLLIRKAAQVRLPLHIIRCTSCSMNTLLTILHTFVWERQKLKSTYPNQYLYVEYITQKTKNKVQ